MLGTLALYVGKQLSSKVYDSPFDVSIQRSPSKLPQVLGCELQPEVVGLLRLSGAKG